MRKRFVAAALVALLVPSTTIVVAHATPGSRLWHLLLDPRRDGKLRPGDVAPDVQLMARDGLRDVRLSEELGGRPVVLIFGSFT